MPQGSDKVWWDLPGRTNLKVLELRTLSLVLPRGLSGHILVVTAFLPLPAHPLFFFLESQTSPISRQLRPLTSCLQNKQLRPKSEPSTQTQPRQPPIFPGISPPRALSPGNQTWSNTRALLQDEV